MNRAETAMTFDDLETYQQRLARALGGGKRAALLIDKYRDGILSSFKRDDSVERVVSIIRRMETVSY